MKQIRVFACEAQPIVLEGLARILPEDGEFVLAGSAPSLPDALDGMRAERPDIVLVDQAPGLKLVFQFIADVKSAWPACQPVLWVNDKPMRGAFVERQRAQNIYTSIVTRRRDPALVTWDGPGWIAVSIFPLEKDRARRL